MQLEVLLILFALRFKCTTLHQTLVVSVSENNNDLQEDKSGSKSLKAPPQMASICCTRAKELNEPQLKL